MPAHTKNSLHEPNARQIDVKNGIPSLFELFHVLLFAEPDSP
jgi:hypothetical protein